MANNNVHNNFTYHNNDSIAVPTLNTAEFTGDIAVGHQHQGQPKNNDASFVVAATGGIGSGTGGGNFGATGGDHVTQQVGDAAFALGVTTEPASMASAATIGETGVVPPSTAAGTTNFDPPLAAIPANLPFTTFGITPAAILAPVPPPPKKKRKTQDEFTIVQKLEILAELKGPHALPVPAVAAKHNTSRTSIYRWKKDMPRLLRLAKKDGKGQYKRVSHKRKLYNEEYTAAEKLAMVRELKGENAPSIKDIAARCGANHRSIYRWKRNEERLIKLVEQQGRGDSKRAGEDPLCRIKEALKLFHAGHYAQQQDGTNHNNNNGGAAEVKPLTGTMIAQKAKQIRDEMLAQHERTPFLTEEEVKGMKDFTASSSWGRKIVTKYGWKAGGADASAGGDGTAAAANGHGGGSNNGDNTNDPLFSFTRLPPLPNSTAGVKKNNHKSKKQTTSSTKRNLTAANAEMKKEIASLKQKLNVAESRSKDLEKQNVWLNDWIRRNLLRSGSGSGSGDTTNEEGTKKSELEVEIAQLKEYLGFMVKCSTASSGNDEEEQQQQQDITVADNDGSFQPQVLEMENAQLRAKLFSLSKGENGHDNIGKSKVEDETKADNVPTIKMTLQQHYDAMKSPFANNQAINVNGDVNMNSEGNLGEGHGLMYGNSGVQDHTLQV